MQTLLYNHNTPSRIANQMEFSLFLDKCKSGDAEALGIFVEKFHSMVLNIITKRVRTQSEIEDIEQDFFLRFIERNLFQKFSGTSEAELYGFVVRVAINFTNEYLRNNLKKKDELEVTKTVDDLERMMLSQNDTPESVVLQQELGKALNVAVKKLPAKYKSIVKLRLLSHSHREIAQILDLPKGTVDGYMARGLQILKEDLQDFR